MGSVVKCYTVYATPFWRKECKNGLVAALDEITSVVFYNSPCDGSKGILMGFSLAEKAKQLMQYDIAERTEEPFTKGCYAGMFPPGMLTQYKASLATPFQRIHWAGTETSTQFNGYMEGAV